jgi:hypothetical protein
VDFRLRLDYDIVGLVAVGGDLLVLTDGYPYIVSGNDPKTMVPSKLDALFPCTSKRSIVRMPYGVVFATYDGLAVYAPTSGTQLITQYAFDADAFTTIDTSTIIAMAYRNKYIAKHSTGGFVFEIDGENPRFTTLGAFAINATAMWYDAIANKAYYTNPKNTDNFIGIYEWDRLDYPPLTVEWKSKVFVTQTPINLGAGKIEADFETGSTIIWEDATAQTWDGGPYVPPPPTPPVGATIYAVATSNNSSGDDVFVLNWSDNSIVQALNLSVIQGSLAVKFSPNGAYLAVFTVSQIKILETTGWTTVKTFSNPGDFGTLQSTLTAVWSPDSRYLATTGDENDAIFVFDSQNAWANVYTGTYVAQYFNPGEYEFIQFAWSPDGSYLACANSDYDNLVVFNTSNWSTQAVTTPGFVTGGASGSSLFGGVQFSSDSTILYACANRVGDNNVLYQINTSTWVSGTGVVLSSIFTNFPTGIYLSPDETKLVMGDGAFSGIRMWGLTKTGNIITSLTDITISPFISGSSAPTYTLPAVAWKPDSSKFICVFEAFGIYEVTSTGASSVISDPQLSVELYSVDTYYGGSTPPTPPTPPTPSPTPEWTSSQTWGINDPVTFKLWANKVLVATRTVTSNAIFRLPTGYKADKFEMSVEGNVRIRSIHVAETPRGLKEI